MKKLDIKVVNLKGYVATEERLMIRVDRKSVLGNPYKMSDRSNAQREYVCDLYEEYIKKALDFTNDKYDIEMDEELDNIAKLALTHSIDLGCFCAPKRCHGETIKRIVEERAAKLQSENIINRNTAIIEVFGKTCSIEEHLTDCAASPDKNYITINDKLYDKKYFTAYHNLLYIKFLDQNPEIVRQIELQRNAGAYCEVIMLYVTKGRINALNLVKELNQMLKQNNQATTQVEQVLKAEETIITPVTETIDYAKRNNKIYEGCIGKYSRWPITDNQVKLIIDLVETYKVSIGCYETRKEATDAIHKVYAKVHAGELPLRKTKGHVEVINNRYTFVEDGGNR